MNSRAKELALAGLRKLRQEGMRGLFYHCVRQLREQRAAHVASAFDQEFGTDTDGIVHLWRLRIESPYRKRGVRYQATDADFIRRALRALPIQTEEFVYVDIGSGKGRTLLVASEYPFRRVIGVEFSPELNAIAAENIRKYRHRQQCPDVSSICADAARWEFPIQNAVLFMYNPFDEDVLRRVLGNLRDSLAQHERDIYIIYRHPVFSRLLDGAEFLERIETPIEAAIYRHIQTESG